MLCFISDEKNIKLSAYQREFLRACRRCGAVCFAFVVCLGARPSEINRATAYEGVVSNVAADPKIRKPTGIYSGKFIILLGSHDRCELCLFLKKTKDSSVISVSYIST